MAFLTPFNTTFIKTASSVLFVLIHYQATQPFQTLSVFWGGGGWYKVEKPSKLFFEKRKAGMMMASKVRVVFQGFLLSSGKL
jgi:hypothetical protein